MSGVTAFSYSRLNSYEECPKKYHAISVARSIKDIPNEHTQWGTDVHLAFKEYFKSGKPLPLQMKQYEKFLAQIKAFPGEFICEQKLAINTNYEPTGWLDKDVYCRIISDLTILNGRQGIMWDWKTGKPKDDFTQLRLAGAVMFLLVPELQRINLCYLWTKTKEITRQSMTREEMPGVWSGLLPRIERYHNAHVNSEFPAKPGWNCKYCPVKTCAHWEGKS
jgi:CRISPR/Cas system-associated exonuclease Cas4 (RecB family)